MPSDAIRSRSIVLLVDDSPETLSVLIDALEGAGITALVARDGEAALQLLERIEPDLILLDALMPGIDGFATCRRIKALPGMATTPVVFMTGLSDSAHVLEGLRAGGVDYVTKPVRPDEIIARIAVHIANARMIAEARRALDTADEGVVAFSATGEIGWTSPRAAGLLGQSGGGLAMEVRADLIAWLARAAEAPVSLSRPLDLCLPGGREVSLAFIARSANGDILARVAPRQDTSPAETLSRSLGISAREAEVLAWLADGKSNADIATILGLRPRTVTKHVEQIFVKLGVENRTSAAAMALRHLFQSGRA